jgi:hypothetical protein
VVRVEGAMLERKPGGSRGALRLAGKGSAQGLESNVEEMDARPKIPASRLALSTVMSSTGTDARRLAEMSE